MFKLMKLLTSAKVVFFSWNKIRFFSVFTFSLQIVNVLNWAEYVGKGSYEVQLNNS